jgi:putative hemolysin
MPNPASVYCEEHGGKLDIRQDATGGQVGICVFPNGSECDEWAYFRGQCTPSDSVSTPEANMPNPASVYCEEHGGKLDIRQDATGGQLGICVFPNGSECDEWAYFRGECAPAPSGATEAATAPKEFPTAMPIDPAAYQGWWTYNNPTYGFSMQLPEDWTVDESTADALMNGHLLMLHPKDSTSRQSIRMTFRRVGEDTLLWPTGAGEGEFVSQGTLPVVDQPAQRLLLVCPDGRVTSVWYQGENSANIQRGDMEFGFIFSTGENHCGQEGGLEGKTQLIGEMIIASLKMP